MISVEEAKEIINFNCGALPPIKMPLANANGYILAAAVFAPINSPPFNQSAMDGYAFNSAETDWTKNVLVSGLSQTGDTKETIFKKGSAIRIYTGAAVPNGADTVIIQEHVELHGNHIVLNHEAPKTGSNIRLAGSQIKIDECAAQAGTLLNAGTVGYLIGLGIEAVEVIPKPKIGIIVTGKELVKLGSNLMHGQVYESNSIMLKAALQDGNLVPELIAYANDIEAEITATIKKAIATCEVVLVTGGISVGDFDFVGKAFENLGVEKLFYKVKQKPGKPLYAGKLGNTFLFGLPGNPSSVLSCYYEYVVPCLRKMRGYSFEANNKQFLPLGENTHKKGTLTNFLKGRIDKGFVFICEGQESYKLSAFTQANCLVMLQAEQNELMEGEIVEVHTLQNCWTN